MKTKILNSLVIVLFITIHFNLFSQEKRDKIKNMKIAFITEKVALTSSESEKFWPIYNEMEEKLKNIRKNVKSSIDNMQDNSENMSEDEYKKNIQEILNSESQETNIKKEYLNKIASVISYKKTAKLMKAEKEFKQVLLNEIKDKPKPKPNHK